jgi:hypothetical protein
METQFIPDGIGIRNKKKRKEPAWLPTPDASLQVRIPGTAVRLIIDRSVGNKS